MARVLLPVGLLFGPSFADDSGKPRCVVVGRATGPAYLEQDRFGVWMAAHGTPEDAGALRMTRADLVARVQQKQRTTEKWVDKLLDEGLLVEYDTNPGDLDQYRKVFSRLRLKPLAVGAGNDPNDREVNLLSLPAGNAPLRVPGEVKYIWELGLTSSSLWERIDFLAKDRAADPDNHPNYSSDPWEISEGVFGLLPLVIASYHGFLDDEADVTIGDDDG